MAYRYYTDQTVEKQEFEVLKSSFALEDQPNDNGLLSLVSGIGNEDDEDVIQLSPESAEAVRASMEKYIRERQSLYSEQLDEKVMAEQQASE